MTRGQEGAPPQRPYDPRELATDAHVVGDLGDGAAGPTFVVVGGLHGNEPAGVRAAEAVVARCRADELVPRGRFVALAGNLGALGDGVRYRARDLNRLWTAQDLERVGAPGAQDEEAERDALCVLLRSVVAAARGRVVVLDLHSTSADGAPFSIFGDTLSNRRLALRLPVPAILGLEERVHGTLLGWIGEQGHGAIGFEGGQHTDPSTARSCEAAIWILLEALGLVTAAEVPGLEELRAHLVATSAGLPQIVEVRHRHGVAPEDRFEMLPGFRNFQAVGRGERLARDARGDILAAERGRVLLPLYQGQGDDGFFLTRDVRPLWLAVSASLRRLGAARLAPLLPGIAQHPQTPARWLVDRRIARWRATDVLHLLGYRVCGETAEHLVVGRRPEKLPPSGGLAR